jgi:ATPase subunit of ABC transporter with duplicated ATPase domains
MISISNLKLQYSADPLFENVSLQLTHRNRYGMVGANGCGKSTFIKILSGEETSYYGSISIPKEAVVGWMKQDQFLYENERVVDVVISGDFVLYTAFKERDKYWEEGALDDDGSKISELEEIIVAHDGYSAEARACRILDGLGIHPESHFAPMSTLSGGFKLRALLARSLFQNPDILLLDEPTNHLDIISIAWLEDYLRTKFKGMVLVISHDRHFLNKICTHILDVDYRTITCYTGNYDDFLEAKLLAVEQKVKETAKLEKKIDQMQAFVDRFKAKASKARQAQSKAKQIEKIEIPDSLQTTRRYPDLKFPMERNSGREVLKVKKINKSYGEKNVLNDVTFEIERGEKIALLGPNGMGKSTLMKILVDSIKADSGEVIWGSEAKISYFAQEHAEIVHGKQSVLNWLTEKAPACTPGQIRGTLGAMLFTKDEVEKTVGNLSGGEAARLNFAKIMLERPNVLLLDEPTNHLDLESIAALESALEEYQGTLVLVSHDKNFVSNVAKTIFEISPEGVHRFAGDYEEYLENFGKDYLNRTGITSSGRKTGQKESTSGADSYKERKEKKSQLGKLETLAAKLEEKIQTMEKRIKEMDHIFSRPEKVASLKPEELGALQKEKSELSKTIEQTLKDWEEIHGKMQDISLKLDA